jgi:hypothetical protein
LSCCNDEASTASKDDTEEEYGGNWEITGGDGKMRWDKMFGEGALGAGEAKREARKDG